MLTNKNNKSIHLEKFIKLPNLFENKNLNEKWTELKKIRDICNISIEAKRASKEIGSSLEASLVIRMNERLFWKLYDKDPIVFAFFFCLQSPDKKIKSNAFDKFRGHFEN